MSLTNWVNLTLYIIAIALAVYGLWELFPKDAPWHRRRALGLTLLTLLLTTFLTSLQIDNVAKLIPSLVDRINQLTSVVEIDNTLDSLNVNRDPESGPLRAMLVDAASRYTTLASKNDVMFEDEFEGIRFITKLIDTVLKQDLTPLTAKAISIDLTEFESPSLVLNTYNETLLKTKDFRRAYVLSDDTWKSVNSRIKEIDPGDTARLNLIVSTLKDLGLEVIASHYISRVRCALVSDRIYKKDEDRHLYDLLLVYRGNDLLLAANRESEQGLHIVLGESDVSKAWRKRCNYVFSECEYRIDLPEYIHKYWPKPPVE